MPYTLVRLCLVIFCWLSAACGGQPGGLSRLDPDPVATGPSPYVAEDPKGPIPEPSLPPDLVAAVSPPADAAAPGSAQEQNSGQSAPSRLAYTITIVTPDAPELETPFLTASHLEQMREKPPADAMGLDQRMRSDLETARDVLSSFGYYAGKAHGKITRQQDARPEAAQTGDPQTAGGGTPSETATSSASPTPSGADNAETGPAAGYVVTITFEPGARYTIGKTRVSVTDPEALRPDPTKGEFSPPGTSLAAVGLKPGDPALAGAVLDAVAAMREHFRDHGYPFAAIASSRYIVDHAGQTLDAEIVVDSGPLVYMDGIAVKNESPVTTSYLDAKATWQSGQPWNQSLIEKYRNELRQSGLFASAEFAPAEAPDAHGLRAVVAELTPAPPRTVGGSLQYDTDFGPGLEAYWEHRNITGRGDKLRFSMPLWADLQEFLATYRLPFFLRKDQDFTARGAFRNEDTDAYKLTSYLAAAGLERRISPHWTGGLELYFEGGELQDPDEPKTQYVMAGVPVTLAYDNANSLLDASRGFRLKLAAAPYTGEYGDTFTVLRSRVEAQAFLPLIGEDALVLALRGMFGMIADTNAQNVPASLRFYAGGGGSVRGYAYQSLGPRNDDNDPLGGASAVEFSAEARARFSETWGMVAFLDGGMVYADASPNFSEEEPRWGAGLGLRFYTAIGPIRLDFAVPLNKRADDDNFQVYCSIGQNF